MPRADPLVRRAPAISSQGLAPTIAIERRRQDGDRRPMGGGAGLKSSTDFPP